MNSQSTQGPWHRQYISGKVFAIKDKNDKIIMRQRGGIVPIVADQAVLAASAELLEAAEQLLSAGDVLTLMPREGRSTISVIDAVDSLRKAIYKARNL